MKIYGFKTNNALWHYYENDDSIVCIGATSRFSETDSPVHERNYKRTDGTHLVLCKSVRSWFNPFSVNYWFVKKVYWWYSVERQLAMREFVKLKQLNKLIPYVTIKTGLYSENQLPDEM